MRYVGVSGLSAALLQCTAAPGQSGDAPSSGSQTTSSLAPLPKDASYTDGSGIELPMALVVGSLLLLAGAEGARLLRVPRIYNALITSDEELLPSQAYPAVSPVLRPATHLYLPAQTSTFDESHHPPKLPVFPLQSNQEEEILPELEVRNNRPSNPDIPDVPPPPIPVRKPKPKPSIASPPAPPPFV